jgi:hypothetical protein
VGQSENIQLTPEQARHIVGELRKMRHDINNHLAVIMATAELLRERPDMAERLLPSLAAKPASISTSIKAFSAEFEKVFQPAQPEDPAPSQPAA